MADSAKWYQVFVREGWRRQYSLTQYKAIVPRFQMPDTGIPRQKADMFGKWAVSRERYATF